MSRRSSTALRDREAVPVFAALADPTRLGLLRRLSTDGPLSITGLSAGTGVTRQAITRHLRDAATVYVLNPARGFEVARPGTNGFHAFVARTGDDAFRGEWPLTKYRDDILYPIAFDNAGAKAQMRIFFDAAELQAKGTPAAELKRIMQQRLKAGFYP